MAIKTVFEVMSPSNLNDPVPVSNTKPVLIALPVTFLALAWICVIARLYTRFKIIKSPWWDDLCVVLYIAVTTAATISIVKATDYGLGQHFLKQTPETMKQFLFYFYIINASYCTSTALVKLALLLQYLRIFERGTAIYRFTVGIAVFTVLWGIAYSVVGWMPCTTPSKYWSLALDDTCYGFASMQIPRLVATYESHTATNMVLDFILMGIPMRLFWVSGTRSAQRIRLLAIFSLGGVCIVLAAWRLAVIIDNQVATKPVFDPTFYSPLGILLAVLEVDCAAICGCVPTFWPQIAKHLGMIYVVREVHITSEDRLGSNRSHGSVRLGGEDHDSTFSHGMIGGRDGDGVSECGTSSVYRLRQASRDTVMEMEEMEIIADKRRKHYQDEFIRELVDPLRAENMAKQGVVTKVNDV